jgi:hypothetical protein
MKSAAWLLSSLFLATVALPAGTAAQEMQNTSLAQPSPVFQSPPVDLEGKSFDLGVSAGFWFGGNVVIQGFDVDKDGAFLLRIFADSYLMPRFAFGGYFNFSPYSQEGVSITMFEFGAGIKPRFLLAPDFAIKPGLNIGYRFTTSDIDAAEISALGINVSVEFQKAMPGVLLFGEFGFLSQPSGGNADIEVTFAPIFYVSAGIGI